MTGAFTSSLWRRLAVAGCLATTSWAAWALDAGLLRWQATAGQPPHAQIDLRRGGAIDASAVRARIAAREAYAVAGLSYHPALAEVQVSTQTLPGGQVVLRLDRLPVDRGELDLLITVSDRMSLTLAEYHLDFRQGPATVAPAPAGTRLAQREGTAQAAGRSPRTGATPAPAPALAAAAIASAAAASRTASTSAPAPGDAQAVASAALEAWAQAWSRRDVNAYLGAYAPAFKGRSVHASREAWMAERRERISARQQISVKIDQLKAERRGQTIVATFVQRYRSDGISDDTRKRVVLEPFDGRWLITRESDRR